MRAASRPWTDQDDEVLRSRASDPRPVLASELGRSRAAVQTRIVHLGLGRERPTPAEVQAKRRRAARASRVRLDFGISIEEYEAMVDEQDGQCAICSEIPSGLLCVDHNHETGEVRALLCRPCNLGIGNLKDSADRVEKALAYLRKHGC